MDWDDFMFMQSSVIAERIRQQGGGGVIFLFRHGNADKFHISHTTAVMNTMSVLSER